MSMEDIGSPDVLLFNSLLDEAGRELLEQSGLVVQLCHAHPDADVPEDALATVQAVIVRTPGRVCAETISRMPALRVIAAAGTGFEHIDVAAATQAGIAVVNNAAIGAQPVAEHVVGMMLDLLKRISVGDRFLRRNGWTARDRLIGPDKGTELGAQTVGIVGLGAIGARVASICVRGFGSRVIAFSPTTPEARFAACGAERVSDLLDLCRRADVLVPLARYGPATHHLIGAVELAAMRPGSYLVNASRGQVVDELALLRALRDGRLAGAGLDVFDPEPPRDDHPLFSLDNVVVTPHIAGVTREASRRLSLSSANQILQVLRCERPPFLLNPEIWPSRPRVQG
ncbi:NAD(P)-dependent oxidoreductase [Siccirubricoccus phaeus]|uniref:NAD(P)-dependent oxidoreductase n=1 Tax=Siccirubricoccus phaeus TaxID=2595053 RepID=UPI0011F0DE0F|nr:hydroxyacid dehydrogenase [Siccirubricoccus phaeus]